MSLRFVLLLHLRLYIPDTRLKCTYIGLIKLACADRRQFFGLETVVLLFFLVTADEGVGEIEANVSFVFQLEIIK
jgi:hypothetical protein